MIPHDTVSVILRTGHGHSNSTYPLHCTASSRCRATPILHSVTIHFVPICEYIYPPHPPSFPALPILLLARFFHVLCHLKPAPANICTCPHYSTTQHPHHIMTSITQLLSPWPVSKHSIVLREQHYPPPQSSALPEHIDSMSQQPSSPNDPNDGVTGSAESDGGGDNGDGRKGYGKRELSTSKRAAQNRAAQVGTLIVVPEFFLD